VALPPIVLAKREPIRLYSPEDPAIDAEATGADVLRAYATAQDLDSSRLVLCGEPTAFVVRALTPREWRVAASRFPDVASADEAREQLVRAAEAYMGLVRFGLVSVEGWDGWTAVREPHEVVPTLRVWSEDAVGSIPASTLLFLGLAIASLSSLDAGKKKASGSSPGGRGGTGARKGRKGGGTARGRSTVRPTARGAK